MASSQYSIVDSLALPWQKERSERGQMALTARQYEVATLIAAGLTLREIAMRLELNDKTVSQHRQRIRAKLGCRDDAQIAQYVQMMTTKADDK